MILTEKKKFFILNFNVVNVWACKSFEVCVLDKRMKHFYSGVYNTKRKSTGCLTSKFKSTNRCKIWKLKNRISNFILLGQLWVNYYKDIMFKLITSDKFVSLRISRFSNKQIFLHFTGSQLFYFYINSFYFSSNK